MASGVITPSAEQLREYQKEMENASRVSTHGSSSDGSLFSSEGTLSYIPLQGIDKDSFISKWVEQARLNLQPYHRHYLKMYSTEDVVNGVAVKRFTHRLKEMPGNQEELSDVTFTLSSDESSDSGAGINMLDSDMESDEASYPTHGPSLLTYSKLSMIIINKLC